MALAPTSRPVLDSPLRLAERALRQPATTVWLDHVSLVTARFEAALEFYVSVIGLQLRTIEAHPAQPTRLRAVFIDAEGRDVLELVEAAEDEAAPARGHLGFSLPRRSWHLLRVRLDARDVAYDEVGPRLHVRDADGTLVKVTALGDC